MALRLDPPPETKTASLPGFAADAWQLTAALRAPGRLQLQLLQTGTNPRRGCCLGLLRPVNLPSARSRLLLQVTELYAWWTASPTDRCTQCMQGAKVLLAARQLGHTLGKQILGSFDWLLVPSWALEAWRGGAVCPGTSSPVQLH